MSVIKEPAVTVNAPVRPFLNNPVKPVPFEAGSEFGALRPLHAVIRPKDLVDSVKINSLAGSPAVAACKTEVAPRMPVLGRGDEVKLSLEPINNRNDEIPFRHRERPAWTEVVLDIHDDENFQTASLAGIVTGMPS